MKKIITNSINKVTKTLVFGALIMLSVLRVNGQATVTATAGVVGPTVYPIAGGLTAAFAAINSGTHQGAITITIGAGGTTEAGTAILNENAAPAIYSSVTIKPAVGANPTITGNIANNGVIHLFGATNVTIDGSNTVGGTTKNLTIRNTTGIAGSAVIRFGHSALTGASNNTVKNCVINMSGPTIGIAITSGGGAGALTFIAGTVANSNNTIQNNTVTNCQTAFYTYGPAAAGGQDNNWNITQNDFNGLGFAGVTIYNTSNSNISENIINNVTINGASQVCGITVSWTTTNLNIFRNKITNISNTNNYTVTLPGQPCAEGIFLTSGGGSTNVYNNFIANVYGNGNAALLTNGQGILSNNAGVINIFHNSIKMTTNSITGAGISSAVLFGPGVTGTTDLRDNIIVNSQTSGTRYGIYCSVAPAIFTGIDYNDYFAISGNLGFVLGTPRLTIGQIQAGFGSNLNSISLDPVFMSTVDLHLQTVATNLPLAAGVPIGTVPNDIDNANRSATAPTIGAHEFTNKITYTGLGITCRDWIDTLSNVRVESPVGVPLAGPLVPRLYFRKGAGPWNSVGGLLMPAPVSSANTSYWRFPIDYSTIGGVIGGDIIHYYVVAQTTSGTVFGNSGAGLVAIDVNTITTPPTPDSTYTVRAVALLGLTTSNQVCFNPTLAQTALYGFTGTTGSPDLYTLIWTPPGFLPPVTVFASLPGSSISTSAPPATPAIPFNGTVTIRNAASGCERTYFITLTVNPLPATITGTTTFCFGNTTTLTSPSGAGTWTSSNPAVATVTPVGATTIVTGVSGGTSTISFTLPTGCKTFTVVNVITPPGPITGADTVCIGGTTALGNIISGGTWSSSSPLVGTIDPVTGVFEGITAGLALVSYVVPFCTTGASVQTRVIRVRPNPGAITGLLHVCGGEQINLYDTSTAGTWISGAPAVATVASITATSGSAATVTGVSGGTATITFRYNYTGCIATNTVNVHPAAGPIVGGPFICQGLSTTLTNSVTPGTWSSSLPGVISIVAATGVATAHLAAGSTMITYTTSFNCKRTAPLYISTAPTAIGGANVLCSEYTVNLSNGTAGGTWTSSNPSIATVGASSGVVLGIVGGVVTISYVTTVCNPVMYSVTVNQTPPPITGGITLCNGGSTTSLFNSTPGGVWTISGSASISPTGVVTGLTIGGSNMVTYTVSNGCYRTAPIIVDTLPAPITGIDTICQGRSTTLMTASTGGLWSSNNAVIASIIASTGVVTGVNHGMTTITYAALSGCYRTMPFTVSNPLPASVTLTRTPGADTLCMGTAVTFTAHPTNGGMSPAYQWQLFGVNIDTVTVDDSTYSYTPTHGDVIRVYLFNSLDICAAPSPANVDMPINIYPNVSPVINMKTTTPTSIVGGIEEATMSYLGQVVTFNTLVTSGGPAPSYQWFVDDDPIAGATDNYFVRTVYDDDVVYCRINGNPPCETGSLASSNKIYLKATYLQTTTVEGLVGSLSLFPNPNTGTFTLSGTLPGNSNEVLNVKVLNVLGQVVYEANTTANAGVVTHKVKLDKTISTGTYMLRVSSNSDSKVFHFVVGG